MYFNNIKINNLLKDNKSVNKYVNNDFNRYYNLLPLSFNKILVITIINDM